MSITNAAWNELKGILKEAPEHHLDPVVIKHINKWSDPPTAVEIQKSLDACCSFSLASGMVIKLLESLLIVTDYDPIALAEQAEEWRKLGLEGFGTAYFDEVKDDNQDTNT